MIHTTTTTTTTNTICWLDKTGIVDDNQRRCNMVSHLFSFRSCFVLFKKSYFTFLGWAEGGTFL